MRDVPDHQSTNLASMCPEPPAPLEDATAHDPGLALQMPGLGIEPGVETNANRGPRVFGQYTRAKPIKSKASGTVRSTRARIVGGR
jgi:hypothetical protein